MLFSPVAILLVALVLTSSRVALDGVYAAQTGRPLTHAHLIATQIGESPLRVRLDLWLTRGAAQQTVSRYDVAMTRYLHLIAIDDDFTTFRHVHPVLERDHHFLIEMRFPKAGSYHIYSDAEPAAIGQQVFRYDLHIGSREKQMRHIAPTGALVRTGPYRVALGATRLRVGSENDVAVHIMRDGRPANDLHPYLGALAHAVFIDCEDLSYAHVHPMPLASARDASMNNMSSMMPLPDARTSSPDMMLHVRVREAGTYALWLQFRGGDGLHVAPFVVTAS